jgi:hypothetical protein
VGEPDEDVGTDADGEPDEVGDSEVVADVFNLKIGRTVGSASFSRKTF